MLSLRQAILRICLAAALGVTLIWLLIPLFRSRESPHLLPAWHWVPGYWEMSPSVGIARVIPIAPSSLINPPADAAPKDLPLQWGEK